MLKSKVGLTATLLASLALAGCGHSDEEMAAKDREINKLQADLKAAKAQIAQDDQRYNDAQTQIDGMREQLKQAGISLDKSNEDLKRQQQALAEYKQRADQLAVIEARFRELRAKLEKLNSIGLKVVVRNNRMVIQLPGDILFESGKDELKPQGKEVLAQVADVVRGDKDLNARNFEVAGHTDNAPYPAGGAFKDNWGLSLSRARQVLLFLVAPNDKDKKGGVKGGGLDPKHWNAAGFGQTDPIAGTAETQDKDQQTRNRRVELVVQPNVEEMLNLNNIK
jgi:chemotaxis protein MotB